MRWTVEEGILGNSPSMQALAERVDRIASSNLPALITGETGSGKELVARAIHLRSGRCDGPFVSENCAALADSLLESELFGHERGAFTGATDERQGLFQRAHGGTLFIDEIGDMSLACQAKLLRVLQEGEVRRLGGVQTEAVNVRVIAATHKDLDALIREGRFRQDLLFRLAVLEVPVPPLRERMTDVPALAEHFLEQLAQEQGRDPLALTEGALDRLLSHDWPGNVRELENAVRVGALFSSGPVLDADALPLHPSLTRSSRRAADEEQLSYQDLLERLEGREREYVLTTLNEARGNKAEAARRLGITRYALYRTMRRLKIDPDGVEEGSEERQLIGAGA